MSDQLNLDEPIPAKAFAGVLQRMMEVAEPDDAPEWGFFYLPPAEIIAKFAQEHDAADRVCGVLAAPFPLPPEAWASVMEPVELVEEFISIMENPTTPQTLEISNAIRSGKPAPVVGAWMRASGWVTPERLQAEVERRLKTGEAQMVVADLPDRVDAHVTFAVDVYGRSYMASCPVDGTGHGSFAVEDEEETHTGRQRPNVALRRIVRLASTPVPREPNLS